VELGADPPPLATSDDAVRPTLLSLLSLLFVLPPLPGIPPPNCSSISFVRRLIRATRSGRPFSLLAHQKHISIVLILQER
jgi:hypothetical protein